MRTSYYYMDSVMLSFQQMSFSNTMAVNLFVVLRVSNMEIKSMLGCAGYLIMLSQLFELSSNQYYVDEYT